MARLLLNKRASRITVVDNILLLPAEVKDDDQLGKVITPSKTIISQRKIGGKPSPYDRIEGCPGTQRLFAAGVIAWGDTVDEPPEAATPKNAALEASKGTKRAEAKAAADTAAETPKAEAPQTEGKKGKG